MNTLHEIHEKLLCLYYLHSGVEAKKECERTKETAKASDCLLIRSVS